MRTNFTSGLLMLPLLDNGFLKSILVLVLLAAASLTVRGDIQEFRALPKNGDLDEKLKRVAELSRHDFPRLTDDNLALSVIDLSKPESVIRADYHGDAPFYPASLVKLFFMVAAFQQDHFTPEIERALREMIRVSDNDAAAFLVDVLTDTTSGPELKDKALEDFLERRRSLNRYFASKGYDISVFIKPWSFGPFGRDMQIMGEKKENRNRATANAIASILYSIVQRKVVSASASDSMMALLERPLAPPRPEENQVKDFFGESLPPGARLWSKEGDTSEVRHDAAYVELPNGRKYIIVILTRGVADDKTVLPVIGRYLLQELNAEER
ncbi:MAG: serine hydrolase [Chthoniobacterales bacterium]|nr:serine hydrolase [Chthoniobacterales bacterium]